MNFSPLPCILIANQSQSPSLDQNNILVKGTNYTVHHYAIFCSSLLLPFITIYSPHNPALKHHLCLTLEGLCIIFCNIYIYIYTFRDTQGSRTDCLLMLRCQLYMFRTVTFHPQELLFRCRMCR